MKYGVPAPTYDEVFKTVGGSILITARKILAAHGNDEALAQPVCEHYLKIFPDRMFDGLRPMPFAREIVAAIRSRGMKAASFTNKQQEGADAIVEKLGFELDAVVGTSLHSPRKPRPRFHRKGARDSRRFGRFRSGGGRFRIRLSRGARGGRGFRARRHGGGFGSVTLRQVSGMPRGL